MAWTAVLLAIQLVAGLPFQELLGHHSNALIGAVVFFLAWIWGRTPGGLIAFGGVVANAYLARRAGLDISTNASILIDAIGVGGVGFLVGHIGGVLEAALGAEARTARAYDELEAAARDRMLTITDQVPIGLYRSTPDGNIIGGNDALWQILGYPDKAAMLQANVLDHYVDAEDRLSLLKTSVEGRQTWSEFPLRKTDGSVMWVRDWAVAVLDDAGQPLYFDGVLEDVTEQHLADERFRAAFEDSPYGMAISNADGVILRGNTAIAASLGLPLEQLENTHYSEFTLEEDMHITPAALEKVIAGESVRYEKRLLRPDGSFFWALISLSPIRDAADPPLFISHMIDITERRLASEALENLIRSKNELIASVSHELRTPLTVVHGLAQELDSSWVSFTVPEQKEFIGMIAQQSAEVAHIVEDLLVAARADIGRLPIHPAALDLRAEIDGALSSVPELNVVFELVGDRAPSAFADPSRVRQIVRNLLANAHRYGGSEVRARYGVEAETAWLEVCDNGDGVSRADVSKIFEPYESAHNAAGQPMSVGLGLTVSRTLAELMGGSLDYRYESGWSIFRFELPIPGAVRTGISARRDARSKE